MNNNSNISVLDVLIDFFNDHLNNISLKQINESKVIDFKKTVYDNYLIDSVRLFKINEIVYNIDDNLLLRFNDVYNTLSTFQVNLFMLIDSNGEDTDFYLGVCSNDNSKSVVTFAKTLEKTLQGYFPGIKTHRQDRKEISKLTKKMSDSSNLVMVSSSSQIDLKDMNLKNYGLENFVNSMRGLKYRAMILAENNDIHTISNTRKGYEKLYSLFDSFKKYDFESKKQEVKLSELSSILDDLSPHDKHTYFEDLVSNLDYSTLDRLESLGEYSEKRAFEQNSKRIDDLLRLLEQEITNTYIYENNGKWQLASYIFSEDMSVAEIGASNLKKSFFSNSYIKTTTSILNSFNKNDSSSKGAFDKVTDYLKHFKHPQFYYKTSDKVVNVNFRLSPAVSISGNELGLYLGLPKKEVAGLSVIDYIEFGKEVNVNSAIKKDSSNALPSKNILLGKVYDLGNTTNKDVRLANKSLNMHTFITGSTGTGKTNTVYHMLEELMLDDIPFLVIEPAKGEYKDVFGNLENVNVYSSNPKMSEVININPFMFPESIHVLEHIDGLVEIFSMCWEMEAAMPAFFKDAIVEAYISEGWDMETSICEKSPNVYPDFNRVIEKLEYLVEHSDFSHEVKSNYKGALITRVKSLTVGLNKLIFSEKQTPYKKLFDENCILDLSRIKSNETRALLMSLIVYILNEYRVDQKVGNNSGLKHITVIEEAHNILRNSSNGDSNLVSKSVEILTNSIAEVRTYGEGFIIVDQSPSSVDISAIKNTNTKIILRTPEQEDRETVGRSLGLDERQINEISKLPSGVAIVYQNDWVNPVLTLVDKSKIEESVYEYNDYKQKDSLKTLRGKILSYLLNPQDDNKDIDVILDCVDDLGLNTQDKVNIKDLCEEAEFESTHITDSENVKVQSLIKSLLGISENELNAIKDDKNSFKSLINEKTSGLTDNELSGVYKILKRKV